MASRILEDKICVLGLGLDGPVLGLGLGLVGAGLGLGLGLRILALTTSLDDTQLYIAISKENVSVRLDTLERCIAAVHEWLLLNGLALNPAKSDFVQFSPARCRSRVSDVAAVNVSSVAIHPSSTIKSLGVTLDCHLSFDQQVNNVCKNCYFHIRALRHVRDSLPDDIARMVACSIVTSRLDYCNSLYYNMSDANIRKLQLVQNTLARVVLKLRRDEPITPALIKLHWLPVRQRINFKLATLTFKILQTRQPAYLHELIDRYEPARILRSSSQNLLISRLSRTVNASRAFTYASAAIWNNLPQIVRDCDSVGIFRRKLKTHLFVVAFAA